MVRSLIPWGAKFPGRLAEMEREMETLMDAWFTRPLRAERWTEFPTFEPHVDLAETPTAFEVSVELPGMKPEDFKVEMKDGALWISGEKTQEKKEEGKMFHRVERMHGSFERMLPLPAKVKEGDVSAEYKEGVLKVLVPKSEEVKPQVIPVKTA